ncbi:hypothetical protein ATO6_02600 [Oceanicola sp. 22II-s10i]|uniref:flagellar hook capping FlgD N-terminal domain-containing protein n=1 Tax=Oceanicola sp. 22II-s10i TaxID=1317116 RepID=UPI000B524C8A|nr:flagellar hook capping FlgD N-terminal domain-containing protein [Oceanicola sp. 22II-s10i]OWU85815.1 hypothetical protein ATO6_02600 [Oceanicola sp. 22II-s10i]
MDTGTTAPAAPPTRTDVGPAATRQSGRPAISSDFETFLQMLATQLQNQDPLNPVDSADYAVQLATFSSVEQQVLTNELLDGLIARQTMAGIAGYADWIGLEARSPAPVWHDGTTPIQLEPNPLAAADRTVLVIRDEAGDEAARIAIPLSGNPYLWEGQDQSGDPLPPGHYTFELENHADGELLITDALETYARVTEARTVDGQVLVTLHGGGLVPVSAITGLRDPAGP